MRLLLFLLILLFITVIAFADVVTYQQSATSSVWWNDTVTINGTANYTNGTGIANANVNITVGSVRCNNTTNSNGDYICTFAAPSELGTYTVLINVTNSTGPSVTNTTTLTVKLKFGDMPIGTVDRVVYETPIFIQELSGKINVVFARVTAWRV